MILVSIYFNQLKIRFFDTLRLNVWMAIKSKKEDMILPPSLNNIVFQALKNQVWLFNLKSFD